MKSKVIMAGVIWVLSTIIVNAHPRKTDAHVFNKVIEAFIESHMTNNYEQLKDVLDDEACFNIPRGEKVLIHKKDDLVKQMKTLGPTSQICTHNYEILSQSDALVIARVDFKYDNGMQKNYLILEKDENKNWKIMQVYKMFSTATEDDLLKYNQSVSN